ncbi:DUF3592 domain-containing protein [Alienimonas californiensis]|uniref:DUF3592 domain-containing protein n=1 Tax=Alienimonas californiensis TaxID=2527989 RepID=A0A517P8K5_9PLAN|nr:DUF3592 domain-containing protein [Alienimonas californiensis]QDT15702.1 hypothetical protein CA12_17920 [Alienimonas californiensis]
MTERPPDDTPFPEGGTPAGLAGRAPIAFTAFWTLVWAFGLGAFAVALLPDYWLAVRSLGFASSPGRVIACRVQTHPVVEGKPTYSLDLSYAYRAGGREYVGVRYDANSTRSDNLDWYRRTAATLRPGAAVTVRYDRADPEESLLVPGMTGGHLFKALFAVPFAAFLAGAGRFLGLQIKRRRAATADAGLPRAVADGRLLRMPLVPYSPFVAGAIGAGGVAFIGVVAISLGFGSRPPLWAPAAALLIAAVAAVEASARVARRRAAGAYDLVVDPDRELIALPLSLGRRKRLAIPFAGVQRVGIDEKEDSEGSTYAAAVFLTEQAAADLGVKPTQALTVHFGPSPRCPTRDGLVRWLREQLGQAEGDAAE